MGTWSLGSGASQMHEHQERRKGDICDRWKEVPGMDDGRHLQLRKVVSAGLRGHGGAWKHPEPRCLCAWVLEIGIVRVLEGVRLPEDRHRASAGRSSIEGGRHRVGETYDFKTCC